MTTITLVKARSGLSISCKALGHSGFAKSGEDIVCSAVTILMRTALQVLSQTSGIDFETDTSLRGNLSFSAKVIKNERWCIKVSNEKNTRIKMNALNI